MNNLFAKRFFDENDLLLNFDDEDQRENKLLIAKKESFFWTTKVFWKV